MVSTRIIVTLMLRSKDILKHRALPALRSGRFQLSRLLLHRIPSNLNLQTALLQLEGLTPCSKLQKLVIQD